jgi:hypothetical protein
MSIQTVEIALPSGITIVEIRQGPAGAAGAGEWGDIGGTITDQTDLVSYIGTRLASGEATAKNVEVFVRNVTGATITKGSIVYINGASGNRPTITKAQANNDANSAQTIGFVKADIANNATGYVITSGDLENVNTQALTAGQQLYLSPTTAGAWTTTKPSAPQHLVYVGIVVSAHPTQGIIYVSIQNGYELDELHNVAITSPSTGQVLRYNETTGLWSNQTLPTSVGGFGTEDAGKFAVFNPDGGIAAYAEGVYTGGSFDSDFGSGVTGNSLTSNGVFAGSVSGTGLRAQTDSGTYNAIFGSEASPNDRSFVARVLGAFGWFRGAFTGRIQAAATLTGNRTYTLPDATGNVLLDSTLAPTINAATEDTVALAADQLPMTETAASGALRRITFANLFAFVRAQLGLMTGAVQAAGEWAFQSTTRPTSAGTGTLAANSLITRADGDARLASPFSFTTGSPTTGPWGGNQLVLQPFCTGRPDITSCFVSTFASSPPDVRFVPFWVSTPRTVTTAVIRITAGTNATQTVRGAIYDVDANGMPNNRLSPQWDFSCAATGVVTQAIGASVVLNRGLYWVALQNSVGGTLWGSPALTIHGYSDGTASLAQLNHLFGSVLSTFGQYSAGSVPTSFGSSSMPATGAGFPNRGNGNANVSVPLVGLY